MKLDRIGSVFFLLVGAILVAEGLRLPYMAGYSPGAGFFPLWLGGGLMLLSALLFATTNAPDKPFIESREGFRKTALVAVAFIVYIAVLKFLGLLISLALLLAFLVGVVEKKHWRQWVAVALLGSLNCYLLFELWLGVPLPIGILGI